MKSIVIRDAQTTDLAAVMGIYFEAVHELTTETYDAVQRGAWAPESLRSDEEHWRKRLGGVELLIAERGGRAAGFCAFTRDGHVDLLYTHPDHARRGVARQLLEEAEGRMRSAGTIQARTGASRLSRPLFEVTTTSRGIGVAIDELLDDLTDSVDGVLPIASQSVQNHTKDEFYHWLAENV